MRRLHDLDVSTVREYRAYLSTRLTRSGRPLRPKTIAESHTALMTFLEWAQVGTLSDVVNRRRWSTLGSVQAVCAILGLGLRDVIVFAEGLTDRGLPASGSSHRADARA